MLFSWLFLKNSLFPLLKNELEDIARQIARVVEYTHAEEKDSFFCVTCGVLVSLRKEQKSCSSTETKKNKFGSPEGNTHTKKEKREKNPLQKAPLFLLNSLSKKRRKKERDERRRVAPRGGKSSRDGKYVFSSSLSLAARTFSFLIYIRKKKTSAFDLYTGGKENCPSMVLTFSLCFHYIQAASTTTTTTTTTKLSTLSTRTNESR